jgi:hypothetical protein
MKEEIGALIEQVHQEAKDAEWLSEAEVAG